MRIRVGLLSIALLVSGCISFPSTDEQAQAMAREGITADYKIAVTTSVDKLGVNYLSVPNLSLGPRGQLSDLLETSGAKNQHDWLTVQLIGLAAQGSGAINAAISAEVQRSLNAQTSEIGNSTDGSIHDGFWDIVPPAREEAKRRGFDGLAVSWLRPAVQVQKSPQYEIDPTRREQPRNTLAITSALYTMYIDSITIIETLDDDGVDLFRYADRVSCGGSVVQKFDIEPTIEVDFASCYRQLANNIEKKLAETIELAGMNQQ